MSGFTGVNLFLNLLTLTIITVTSSQKIHEQMNPRELAEIFLSHDVPDYEIVPIYWPRIQKRSPTYGSRVQLRAFGNNIHLWLNPIDGVLVGEETPIYGVTSTRLGPHVVRYIDGMKQVIRNMYEDLSTSATLAVNRDEYGKRRITGIVGSHNLVIRPIPQRFVNKSMKYGRSINRINASKSDDYHYHIVYKTAAKNLTEILHNKLKPKISKRSIPSVVYPEILVIVTNDFYKLFNKSIQQLVLYLLGFWNGVDMKFRSLENPKYRLNIAGILIARDSDALEYINKNRYNDKEIFVGKALEDVGPWLFKVDNVIPVDKYDVAVTMTTYRLDYKMDNDKSVDNILGLAYVSGTCSMNKYYKTMTKTLIIRDGGGYDGIHTAAHELGHSLGADHDGTGSLCSQEDGHIMTIMPILTNKSSEWSECSLQDFTTFLNTNPQCIYNRPNPGVPIKRYLPGMILNAHEQCYKIRGTEAYKIDDRICQSLSCLWTMSSKNQWTEVGSAAAEGTRCGMKKICLHGQCIPEREIYYS